MSAHRHSSALLSAAGALLVLASGARAAQPVDGLARERKFAEQTAQVLLEANLRRPGGVLKVAVIGASATALAPAREAARLIDGAVQRMQPELRFETDVTTLPEQRGSGLSGVSAVVIIDTTRNALHSFESFAVDKNVLTISRRPQDIGLVSVVILLSGEMYRFDDRLREEGAILPPGVMLRMVAAKPAEYDKAYALARTLQINRSGRWIEIVANLRMALTSRPAESRVPINVANGIINDPYVPRFFLSEALAMIGDCEGARLELQTSDPRKRKALAKGTIERVTTAVDTRCPQKRARTDLGGLQTLEDSWATASL